MSSGNSLCIFTPQMNNPPSSNGATLDTRGGISILDFDQSTAETALFCYVLPRNYASGGITATICWAGDGVTSGNVVWGGSWARIQANTTDIDSLSFSTEVTASAATTASTDGAFRYTTIAFTDGTQINSLAASEAFVFKLRRVAADGSDTMAADASCLALELRET